VDTWSVLVPAVLSLFGVGLGTVGTLVGRHLSTRVSTRQQDAQQWAAHRAELKASVLQFLGAVRHVQRAGSSAGQLLDELWLAQQEVDLVAVSEQLRGATYRYAHQVTATAHRALQDPEVNDLHQAQIEFMDVARRDLWPNEPDSHSGPSGTASSRAAVQQRGHGRAG
jgi:hypothetical protein